MTATSRYPDFEYSATEIDKFLAVSDYFTLVLKDGGIVHFMPKDPDDFKGWLIEHSVQDMRLEEGWNIAKRKGR